MFASASRGKLPENRLECGTPRPARTRVHIRHAELSLQVRTTRPVLLVQPVDMLPFAGQLGADVDRGVTVLGYEDVEHVGRDGT